MTAKINTWLARGLFYLLATTSLLLFMGGLIPGNKPWLPVWCIYLGMAIFSLITIWVLVAVFRENRVARQRMLVLECECERIFGTNEFAISLAKQHFKETGHETLRFVYFNDFTKEVIDVDREEADRHPPIYPKAFTPSTKVTTRMANERAERWKQRYDASQKEVDRLTALLDEEGK